MTTKITMTTVRLTNASLGENDRLSLSIVDDKGEKYSLGALATWSSFSDAFIQFLKLLGGTQKFVQRHKPVSSTYGWLYELRTVFANPLSLVAKKGDDLKLWVSAEHGDSQFIENEVVFDRINISCRLTTDNTTCEAGASLNFKGHYEPETAYESLLLWFGLDGEVRLDLKNVHNPELLRIIGAIAAAGIPKTSKSIFFASE